MAFDNFTENTWEPNGDYYREFYDEVQRKRNKITNLIEEIDNYNKTVNDGSENTKTVDEVKGKFSVMRKRLESIRDGLDKRANSLEKYVD